MIESWKGRVFFTLISVLMASGAAQPTHAVPLSKLCGRIRDAKVVTACFSAAKNQKCQETALDVCAGILHTESAIRCVEAVAGKKYDSESLKICSQNSDTDEKIACMDAAGIQLESNDSDIKELILILGSLGGRNFRIDRARLNRLQREYGILDQNGNFSVQSNDLEEVK